MNIYLFFTYGISLHSWKESGLLEREIKLYTNLHDLNSCNITFITYGETADIEIANSLPGINCVPMYAHFNKSRFNFINLIKSFAFPYILKKNYTRPDIIKTNQLKGSWVAILSKYLYNSKLIIRTGYDNFKFLVNQKKYLKAGMAYLLTWISLLFADAYTVTSNADHEFISKFYFFRKSKLLIRPNWVEISSNKVESGYENRILVVGRLEKQKNYEYLINEFQNSNIEIDIYGEGSLQDDLKSLAKDKNVKCNFNGNLAHSDLINEYKKYSLYVSTSLYEGNPKTILESIANGCIALCTDIPNNREIVKNGINGFLFKLKENELSSKVDYLLNNPAVLRDIRKNSILSIENKYGFKKNLEQEMDDYLNLVKV